MVALKGLPVAKAALVSLFVETLTFGVFSVTYGLALWVILVRVRRRQREFSRINKFLSLICTVMYALCVAHLSLGLVRALKAFIDDLPTGVSANKFFSQVNDKTEVARIALCLAITLVAEGFMIYRTFVVWNYNRWVIILPTTLCLATAAVGYMTCAWLLKLNATQPEPIDIYYDNSSIVARIETTFSLALGGHILSTVLIAGRLIWANCKLRKRRVRTVGPGISIWDVIEMIVQSSAIHTVCLVCLLITFVVKSNAWFILLDAASPLLGISFTLLITRVGMGHKTAADELHSLSPLHEDHMAEFDAAAREGQRVRPIEIAVTVAQLHDVPGSKAYEAYGGGYEWDVESHVNKF